MCNRGAVHVHIARLYSWGLLAAKTHQKRGPREFWRPLGAVLASFFEGFWVIFGMKIQYFSYLILKYLNMS